MKTWSRRALVTVGLVLFAASWTTAVEPFQGATQKWRGLFFTIKAEVLSAEKPGVASVGVRELIGFAFYEEGDIATVNTWVSFFTNEGRFHYGGFALFQFSDGSSQTVSLAGCLSPNGAETGEFSFVCGSGRFRGITGTGNFERDGFSFAGDPFVHAQTTYRLLTD